MKAYNKDIGNYGENLAIEFIKSKSYKILEQNYTNRYGEIDIIALKDDLLVFIEVKSRYSTSFGNPLEAVTYSKQKRIYKLSSYYILLNNYNNFNVRFDVIEILFNTLNQTYMLNHMEDAFRLY